MTTDTTGITGTTANGVPYLVVPAALPLAGLDAWKVYLGLPLSGSRAPEGGIDEIMRLGREEPVMNLHWPIHERGVAEFPAAFTEIRARFGIPDAAPLGLLGGSAGSSIAAGVLAGGQSGARAAVLVSPMLSLRPIVEVLSEFFAMDYSWTEQSTRAAERMDFVARASEIVATGAAVRVIVGLDDSDGAKIPAREFAAATGADLHEIPRLAHALAEEPGVEAAPQTAGARQVDALAAEWLRTELT